MFMPLSTLGLTAALLLVAGSDNSVPKLDIQPSCRDAATLGDSIDGTFTQCMNDERDALAELQKEWQKFSPGDRQSCVAEQGDSVGLASYVELLECLVLARDAADSEKTTGSG